MPNSIRAVLGREVLRALRAPDVHGKLLAQGLDTIASSPEEATLQLKSIAERWATVIKAANIKGE